MRRPVKYLDPVDWRLVREGMGWEAAGRPPRGAYLPPPETSAPPSRGWPQSPAPPMGPTKAERTRARPRPPDPPEVRIREGSPRSADMSRSAAPELLRPGARGSRVAAFPGFALRHQVDAKTASRRQGGRSNYLGRASSAYSSTELGKRGPSAGEGVGTELAGRLSCRCHRTRPPIDLYPSTRTGNSAFLGELHASDRTRSYPPKWRTMNRDSCR